MDSDRALRTLVERYASTVDRREFDSLDRVFTAGGVLETPAGVRDGLAAIQHAMQGLHRYRETDHRVGAASFAISGAAATGSVECVAHHLSVDEGVTTDRVMTITYHDAYVDTDDGWRIERRRLEVHQVETLEVD